MQSEYWTLVDADGIGLYLVDSEAEALKWCEADYGGANVIRPCRVYMEHDIEKAYRRGYDDALKDMEFGPAERIAVLGRESGND